MDFIFNTVAVLIYISLGMIALWGAFCVIMVWFRVAGKRFRNEAQQQEFLDAVDHELKKHNFDDIGEMCDGDQRAMPQLVIHAVANRKTPFKKLQHLVVDRFQRDVIADLEYRISWVNTVIKTAPMVGLLGTVIGMMGAFAKLAGDDAPKAADLAADIQTALITTACGLAIAIPLVLCLASINVRIRMMEDLVAVGLTHFFDSFKESLASLTTRKQPARMR